MRDTTYDEFDNREKSKNSAVALKNLKGTRDLRDFGYHGELDLRRPFNPEGLWGFCDIGTHRDADLITRSNWEVITEDLLRRFPEQIEIVSCSHWAVGWYDHLAVKWTAKNGTITCAGLAVLEWLQKLADYPLADEDHYSELESNEYSDTMRESIRSEFRSIQRNYWLVDPLPADPELDILHHIETEAYHDWQRAWDNEGWLDADAILNACAALGYLDYNSFDKES